MTEDLVLVFDEEEVLVIDDFVVTVKVTPSTPLPVAVEMPTETDTVVLAGDLAVAKAAQLEGKRMIV